MSYETLLHNIPKQLGTHYIRTKLYAIPLTKLRVLYESCIQTTHFDSNSPEYKLDAIIMDISNHRLFKPVQETSVEEHPRSFLTMKFANKGLDAVRLSNILNHKSVISKIPQYFKNVRPPCISYSYTNTIASKIFNYKATLRDFDLATFISDPPSCSCDTSCFNYVPVGHVVTGDLSIVKNDKRRSLMSKGPKYREPQSFKWNHNFRIIMDAVESYARSWARTEGVDHNILSEWTKTRKFGQTSCVNFTLKYGYQI